jgi:hypothetical protein
MGTQQMMLMILGIIVVGIAIAVGIMLFTSTSASSNRDAIINDMMNLGQYAYRFKLKPEPLGGGGRRYSGFIIPQTLATNENASYVATPNVQTVSFTGTSKLGYGTVTAVLDSAGILGQFTYTGDLQ